MDSGVLPVVNDVCAQDSCPLFCSSRTGPKERRPDFSQRALLCKKEICPTLKIARLDFKQGNLRMANSFSNKLLFLSFDVVTCRDQCFKIHHKHCMQTSLSQNVLLLLFPGQVLEASSELVLKTPLERLMVSTTKTKVAPPQEFMVFLLRNLLFLR